MARTPSSTSDLFDLNKSLAAAQPIAAVTRKTRGPQPSPFDEILKEAWTANEGRRFPVPAVDHDKVAHRLRTAARRMNMGLEVGDPKSHEELAEHVWLEFKPVELRVRKTADAATSVPSPAE
jgi:hypothetical protein